MRKALNWGVFALVMVGLYALAGPTALGGSASYVIVDGTSMEPTYRDGDLVIAYAGASYDVGDVIVYDAPVRDTESQDLEFNVVHRVVDRVEGGYRTQGDNRGEPDGWIAADDAVYGSVRLHVPYGGRIATLLKQPSVIVGLVAGLLAFEYAKRQEKLSDDPDEADASEEPPGGHTDPDRPLWTARA